SAPATPWGADGPVHRPSDSARATGPARRTCRTPGTPIDAQTMQSRGRTVSGTGTIDSSAVGQTTYTVPEGLRSDRYQRKGTRPRIDLAAGRYRRNGDQR